MTYTTARIFTHVQATPEATWVIPHNLSTSYPIVTTWVEGEGGVVTTLLPSVGGDGPTLLHTIDNPISPSNGQFGRNIDSDGNYMIVGGPNNDQVVIYDTITNVTVSTLINPGTTSTNFGDGVAISGNYAIVGNWNEDTDTLSNSGSVYVYDVPTGNLLFTLVDPSKGANDKFGYSVSLSGNYAAIGAKSDDTTASNGGSVYIYNVTTGIHLVTLVNPTPAADDSFGESVAISGDYTIVGANMDDTGASSAGSAYIFDTTTGALLHEINNPTPGNDRFGSKVAISDNYAIVGAVYDDTNATNSGSAYIYNVTTGTLLWTLNNPSPSTNARFGESVSIDGDVVVVGVPEYLGAGISDVGRVYIYSVTTGALLNTIDNPTPTSYEHFGAAVSITGDTLVIGGPDVDQPNISGTGVVYIYDIPTNSLVHTVHNSVPDGGDYYGQSVGVDGNYGVVGCWNGFNGYGAVYIHDVATGDVLHGIPNPTPVNGDRFGYSVAISDGRVVVGAYNDDTGATNAGSAYIFDAVTGSLMVTLSNPSPESHNRFGHNVSIDGDFALVGAYSDRQDGNFSGRAYIFNATTGNLLWSLHNPTPVSSEQFGFSVSISGNYAIVGTPQDSTDGSFRGIVYIYNVTTGDIVHTIHNPTPTNSHRFGYSVSIRGDYAIVGTKSADSAYIFNVTTGALVHTLPNPNPSTDDQFGISTMIHDDYALVGAQFNDPDGVSDAGSVYVFDVATGTLLYTLNNPESMSDDGFGEGVSTNGEYILVGASYDDPTSQANAGSAYIYQLQPPVDGAVEVNTPNTATISFNAPTIGTVIIS